MKHIIFGIACTASLLVPVASAAQVAVVSAAVTERGAAPGETYNGSIRLENTTDEPQEAKVYQTDYVFFADGKTLYGEPGTTERSNARWISISPTYLTIPPGEEVTVSYTVAVPSASRAGTYWSMVMVEGIRKGSAESSVREPNAQVQFGIRPTIRYGVQIATHVQGPAESRIEFTNTRVDQGEAGHAVLRFDIENAGERAHRVALSAELYDAQGNPVGEFSNQRGLLYPGTSVRQEFDLGALPTGAYTVLLLADTGGDEIFGARYQLSFQK
jgi:hypothetical protein